MHVYLVPIVRDSDPLSSGMARILSLCIAKGVKIYKVCHEINRLPVFARTLEESDFFIA